MRTNIKKALQELIDAIHESGKIGYGDHPELEAALTKAETTLSKVNSCSEYITEENVPDPYVRGGWYCELFKGHKGLHQYTHTFEWSAE